MNDSTPLNAAPSNLVSPDYQPSKAAFRPVSVRPTPTALNAHADGNRFRRRIAASIPRGTQGPVVAGCMSRPATFIARSGGYPASDGNHRMPLCVRVMRESMSDGDSVLCEPPSGTGATLTIRYLLPRP